MLTRSAAGMRRRAAPTTRWSTSSTVETASSAVVSSPSSRSGATNSSAFSTSRSGRSVTWYVQDFEGETHETYSTAPHDPNLDGRLLADTAVDPFTQEV